ncbi:MAG: caspase family protein [Lysobacteraceae bacterium]|nr:MAG: caspase family protein [Xanthomonadaceae bacterium]
MNSVKRELTEMLRVLLLVAAAFFLSNSAFAQAKENRLALVISQTAYSHNLSRLPGTENEGRLIEEALKSTGFTVLRARDLSRARLEEVLAEFSAKLSAAGPDAIGFIYYTGHGVQHPKIPDNYLLGIDANLQNVSDLPRFGLNLKSLTEQFAAIQPKAVFLVFDACRKIPDLPGFKGGRKALARSKREMTRWWHFQLGRTLLLRKAFMRLFWRKRSGDSVKRLTPLSPPRSAVLHLRRSANNSHGPTIYCTKPYALPAVVIREQR